MAQIAKDILPVNLEDEMRQSYLDYAMSVIVGRALPDVRDGLKPVHRRVLYAMSELGNDWNKPYKKSSRIVGDVIGKYHPHGDTAVYDTIVRMAQPFSMRHPLVDGQGNFGSVDGDAAAAMRYTEVRMARIAHELLADIDKDTVDFVPNYDNIEQEPCVLPTRVPNLLVNGSTGIAVGMATNVPPHNLSEVIDACVSVIDDSHVDLRGLMEIIPGPDFPTAGIINGTRGIREAYRTGRGRIYVRARAHIESDKKRERIVVTELPYQVNKARLLEKIAELVKDKKLDGITNLRDESDKDGMRLVIELRAGEVAEVVLNNLYQHTQMQSVFGINIVALVDNQPKIVDLKNLIECFIRHRREVVTRRTVYDLRKAREKAHILEGLAVALTNIDEIIALIKASQSPAEAKAGLVMASWKPGAVTQMLARAEAEMSRPENLEAGLGLTEHGYLLSESQAQAILDLRLHRLTGLEQDKIVNDYSELLDTIGELMHILSDPDRLMQVIRDELISIKEQFGEARRTEILEDQMDLTMEDLVTEEDVVVTLSHAGYAKAQPLDIYRAQRRGGKGKAAARVREQDFIDKLFIANTHDTILCFSSRGKVYWIKVYQLPQAGRIARGKPIANLLPLTEGERINAVLPVREYVADRYVIMATSQGTVKKTPLTDFSRQRSSGIIALELRPDDYLVDVALTDGDQHILLVSNAGKAVCFPELEARAMGRNATGVRGIRLKDGQRVIALITIGHDDADAAVLVATEKGFGKRTLLADFPLQKRGGQGVISMQTSARNGMIVGAVKVNQGDELMLITDSGTLVRTPVKDISVMGRNTQGVTLIRLGEDESLVEVEHIPSLRDEET